MRAIRNRLRHFKDVAGVIHGSFYGVHLGGADVVTMYLMPQVIRRLVPKLERELKAGARVVSHDYQVPGWRPDGVEVARDSGRTHYTCLYTMPQLSRTEGRPNHARRRPEWT